jgi:hypothetical protein
MSNTAESPILRLTVPIGPIRGKSCLAMEAPPCTQIIAKSVAEIARFEFFISKFDIRKQSIK